MASLTLKKSLELAVLRAANKSMAPRLSTAVSVSVLQVAGNKFVVRELDHKANSAPVPSSEVVRIPVKRGVLMSDDEFNEVLEVAVSALDEHWWQ